MVDAFATYAELGVALNRTFTVGAESAWITSLLEDASTYLRDDVLGQQVFPQTSSTFTAWPDGGRVDLPQSPVISVDSVVRDGVALVLDDDYTRRDNTISVNDDKPLDITFTYGYATAPESLKRWCMVLVSQALIPLEQQLGLNAGGLSSVAIDDFKAAWANAGEESGITLSDRNIKLLREQFGVRGSTVVTTR
jgi:hypothetical protein